MHCNPGEPRTVAAPGHRHRQALRPLPRATATPAAPSSHTRHTRQAHP